MVPKNPNSLCIVCWKVTMFLEPIDHLLLKFYWSLMNTKISLQKFEHKTNLTLGNVRPAGYKNQHHPTHCAEMLEQYLSDKCANFEGQQEPKEYDYLWVLAGSDVGTHPPHRNFQSCPPLAVCYTIVLHVKILVKIT